MTLVHSGFRNETITKTPNEDKQAFLLTRPLFEKIIDIRNDNYYSRTNIKNGGVYIREAQPWISSCFVGVYCLAVAS